MKKKKKILQFFKSLKLQLVFLVVILGLFPGIILSTGILKFYEARAISIREGEVLSQAKILSNKISTSSYMSETEQEEDTLLAQMDMITTIYDGRVIIVDDAYCIVYDTFNIDEGKTIISEEVIRSFSGKEIIKYDSKNNYIEMSIPIVNPNDSEENILGVMLISVSTDNVALTLSYLRQIAIIINIILTVLVIFAGILLARHMTSPLNRMANGIAEIKNGYGDNELLVNEYLETIQICEEFNELIAQMKLMDDSRQEFVSNVSHELKTPLTSMKVLADSINSMDGAPIELYQEFMSDITNEIERETKIINDLLSLVKMDKSAADLNIETVNINELLEQILRRLKPIADQQQVEVLMESFRPISAEVDEVKFTLAVTNLVENAVKYNRNDGTGWVHVTLNADHQYFYLKVEDSGIGIPEEELEYIYERFYRVDKSHSREIGGTGLGLAITRSCILMHRGAIKAHSVMGEGTTFDVRIPLNYIA